MFTFCKARWARRKENYATKVTKIPKTTRRKYGMTKTLTPQYNLTFEWFGMFESIQWRPLWSFSKNIFKNFENNSLSNPNCVTFWKKIKDFLEYTNFISNSLHHLTTVGISVKCPLCIQISWVPIIIFKFNFILWSYISHLLTL